MKVFASRLRQYGIYNKCIGLMSVRQHSHLFLHIWEQFLCRTLKMLCRNLNQACGFTLETNNLYNTLSICKRRHIKASFVQGTMTMSCNMHYIIHKCFESARQVTITLNRDLTKICTGNDAWIIALEHQGLT